MVDIADGPTVLIVDKDFGFAFWLAEIFTELGCHPVPGLDCQKAVSLATELTLKVNVVVVNPAMPGISKMMQSLSRLYPSVKVVAVVDDKVDTVHIEAHAMLKRPSGLMPISRQEWIRRVRQALRDLEIVGNT